MAARKPRSRGVRVLAINTATPHCLRMAAICQTILEPNAAFSRLPPVRRADLIGQLRVDSGPLRDSDRWGLTHYLVLARRKSAPSHRRSIRVSKPESHSVGRCDADYRNAYELTLLRSAAMYLPNFLDGFDRLVAFDAETTGKRTPDAEFIRKQPFAWRAPGIIIEVGFVEMLRECEGWRTGETWFSRVNPDGPIDPEAIKIHGIRPADLKNAPRFPTILPKVKDFVGESPIVAHAYKNERDFLDYEFARAKVIQWGESAYAEERYICTQVLFAQLFPGASKSLTSMCDRLVLDSSGKRRPARRVA
jgi:DNA polymerase-3 subunit epsilon